MNFGLETAIDSQKVFFRGDEKVKHHRHRSQTKSIFNFTEFYTWSKLQGKEARMNGRKKGGIAEESGESLKLDKVRENRGRWRPFRVGNDPFTRAFTNTHDYPWCVL